MKKIQAGTRFELQENETTFATFFKQDQYNGSKIVFPKVDVSNT